MAVSRATPIALGQSGTAGPWTLTVLQAVTGADATNMVLAANDANESPADGITYVCVQIRAVNNGTRPFRLDQADFVVTGQSGAARRAIGAFPPAPSIDALVPAGQTQEGWFVGAAAVDETNLILWYDSTSITGRWADQYLALQDGAAVADVAAPAVAPNEIGNRGGTPAVAGETIATADWAVQLLDVVSGQGVVDLFPASDYRTTALAGAEPDEVAGWIGLRFQITNNRTGGIAQHFPATAFLVTDDQGEPIPDIGLLTPPNPDAAGPYFPGGSRPGWVLFELPADFAGSLVRFLPYATDSDPRFLTWGDAVLAANPTPAAIVDAGTTVVISEDVVRLRAQPSTDADVVAELERGTKLTVTGAPVDGSGYQWYPVDDPASGQSGYVAINFVQPES